MSVHKKHVQQISALQSKVGGVGDGDDDVVLGEDEKLNLLEVILHAADISNACKPRALCVEWAQRVVEEFRMEGDAERRLNGKVSDSLFSREHPLEKGQKGWIQFVMKPYFGALNEMLGGDLDVLIRNLEGNLSHWGEHREFAPKSQSKGQDDDEKAEVR